MQTVQLLSNALLESINLTENVEDRRKAIEDVLIKHIRVVGAFNDHEKERYEAIKDTQEFKDYISNNCSNIISKELVDANLLQRSTLEEANGIVKSVCLAYVLDTESFKPKEDSL